MDKAYAREDEMGQERGAEITFTVHPRPAAVELPRPGRAEPLHCRLDAPPRGTAAEDVSRHADTPIGDLAFLVRFAFGGY